MKFKIQKYLFDSEWSNLLKDEFEKEYFNELNSFLNIEYAESKIFPTKENIFSAFNHTPFSKVKAVIIGQDPYHGEGQAHGLCFSVMPPTKIPPSLRNIYKELNSDIGMSTPLNGDLTKWADEGVLLLNSILTVKEASPMSHQKKGWEKFTERVIQIINDQKTNVVFLAWGNPAYEKIAAVDPNKHKVLRSVHPSPLSAHRGFLGCKHFSACNEYLRQNKIAEIDWMIS